MGGNGQRWEDWAEMGNAAMENVHPTNVSAGADPVCEIVAGIDAIGVAALALAGDVVEETAYVGPLRCVAPLL